MKNKVFALVDCNNFYASCERVFAPNYKNTPVVILSNNDGCVIARSNEAKQLGIPMGAPAFKYRSLFQENNVKIFSSNFALYGDLSRRVVNELRAFTSQVEVYSIDESFLELTDRDQTQLTARLLGLKDQIQHNLSLPVSIGVAPTKTLAKCFNKIAKKNPEFKGVANYHDLHSETEIDHWLSKVEIADVWGVGFRYSKLLKAKGIRTAKDLKYANRYWLRQKMTIQGERLWLELNGISCRPLISTIADRKMIACTRSFGRTIDSREELREAITAYASRVGEKLRSLGLKAEIISIFIRTSGHIQTGFYADHGQYSNSAYVKLLTPTNYTPYLVKYALATLNKIYKPGFAYYKAGVIVGNLSRESEYQLDLLNPINWETIAKHSSASHKVDLVNAIYGKDTIRIASQGLDNTWRMKQAQKSPCYTTVWEELKKVPYLSTL